MSTQQTIVVLIGHRFKEAPPFEDVPKEYEFHNFESYNKQNMDGELKCLVDGMCGEYTIIGFPLSVTYLDEGETLGLYTVAPIALSTLCKEVEQKLIAHPLMGKETPNVKLHILMHVT